jgi:very-short-patch-repair endonuclease
MEGESAPISGPEPEDEAALPADECTVMRFIAAQRCTSEKDAVEAGTERANLSDDRGGEVSVDWVIAELAERQHGVVGRKQLLELGIKANAINGRVRRGHLHTVHRGAYAVGHRVLGREGRLLASVLACGPGTVLSHRSAASLWRILPDCRGPIEVTKPQGWRGPAGVWVHRSLLPDDEKTTIEGVPVTTVPRTLLDLATVVTRRRLEQAINEVEVLRLMDPLSLPDLLERYPRRRGSALLRRLIQSEARFRGITRSELEDRFIALLDARSLPRPRLNASVRVRGRFLEVDCLWAESGLILELDGRAAHRTNLAFERDRERDRLLIAAGWRVIRLTWRQIHDDSDSVISDLRRAMRGDDGRDAREAA